MTVTCPHCDKDFDGIYAQRNCKKHTNTCRQDPAYWPPVYEFIRSIAHDERMPRMDEYNALKPAHLPSAYSIQVDIRWGDLAELLDLSMGGRKSGNGFPRIVDREIDVTVAHTRSIEASERLSGYGLTTGPWRERTYTDRAGQPRRERYATVY